MKVTLTIEHGADVGELKVLIELLTRELNDRFVVFEAPSGIDYSFSFPVVTVAEGGGKSRQFGSEAVDLLRNVAHQGRPALY